MAYVWTETIAESTDIERDDIEEIRTNVNSERVDRAGLAAYDWTNDALQGRAVDTTPDISEIRGAIDDAYDLLLECAAHYTTDDSAHYTTDDSSHDSSDNATHYASHDATHYTTDDSSDDSTHYTTHYVTDDAGDYTTHYAAANSGRKSNYMVSVGRCMGYNHWLKRYSEWLLPRKEED